MSKKVIGIDLGSTASEVAIIENGKATVIANEDGSFMTPSVVSFIDGERKVGSAAKRQMIVHPKETINLIKRLMGATYDECKDVTTHVQYDIVNDGGMPRVNINGRKMSPEEISSYIVAKMKKVAEDYCGEEIKDAVITVPAYFNDAARQATKTAGELAGLNVLRIIAEPTAAILSSNIDKEKDGKYMVVDFGGATEDNSIADIGNGIVEILATNGDVYLGGSDIDKAIADYVVADFRKDNGIDLSADAQAMTRVLDACEKAKIELSQNSSAEINLPYITVKDNVPLHMNVTLTRAKFEQLITPIIDKLISCAKKAVEMANIKASDLDGILLVGGSCRIPLLQERLTKEFGAELIKSSNMDLAVAEGAAIQADIINGGTSNTDVLLVDVTPLSIGIETLGGVFTKLIEGNTTIPCKKSEIFSTAQDNQSAVSIVVCQGERPMAKDNKQIGMFMLDGILPARRGVPQIEVSFDVDVNGILTVSATDKGTGKEQHITIEGGNKLSDEEIAHIKEEAEKFAEADKKAKEDAETINMGDQMVFSNESLLEQMGEKLTEDDKKSIQGVIDELKDAVKEKNVEKIKELEKRINDVWQPISQKMYEQSTQGDTTQQEGSQGAQTPPDDNVTDASFEEVKE